MPPAPASSEVAIYDAVSGVYTGAYLRVRAAEEIARAKRYPTNFALLLAQVQGLGADPEATYSLATGADGGGTTHSHQHPHRRPGRPYGQWKICLAPSAYRARGESPRRASLSANRHADDHARGTAPSRLSLNIGFAVFPMDGTTVDILLPTC